MKNKWKVCSSLGCALVISGFNQRLNTDHPRLYNVSKASHLGIFQLAANRSTNTVAFVRKKAIITRTVPTGRTKSVKIVTEVTTEVSRYCPVKQEKLKELCSRKQYPIPSWLAKLKHNRSK